MKVYTIQVSHWAPGIKVVYGEFSSEKEASEAAEKISYCQIYGYEIVELNERGHQWKLY